MLQKQQNPRKGHPFDSDKAHDLTTDHDMVFMSSIVIMLQKLCSLGLFHTSNCRPLMRIKRALALSCFHPDTTSGVVYQRSSSMLGHFANGVAC